MDRVEPAVRSRIMSSVSTADTGPELTVRKALHALGFRYRLHAKELPGRPDIVLPRYRTIVFVNGCFWHAHAGCRYGRLPKSRLGYWAPKIQANKERDSRNISDLERFGWRVVTVWQCQTRSPSALEAAVGCVVRVAARG